MTSPRSLLWPALTGVLLTGCIDPSEFVPKVAFDKLAVRELDWTQVSTDFVFAVNNPNPVGVGVAEFAYDLDLEEVDFLNGDNDSGFQLEPSSASELRLPIDLVFADLLNTVQATRGEDGVDFRLSGRFGFDTPIGRVRVPYDEAGVFPALRTPRFRFAGLRVNQVDLTGATLELELGVDNEHGSNLIFDNFAYGLDVEGREVGSGLVTTFDVPGGSEGVLKIPFAVSFANAGGALAQAILNGGPLDLGLSASVDVDTPFGAIPLAVNQSGQISVSGP